LIRRDTRRFIFVTTSHFPRLLIDQIDNNDPAWPNDVNVGRWMTVWIDRNPHTGQAQDSRQFRVP
jgi:hypothetical protein